MQTRATVRRDSARHPFRSPRGRRPSRPLLNVAITATFLLVTGSRRPQTKPLPTSHLPAFRSRGGGEIPCRQPLSLQTRRCARDGKEVRPVMARRRKDEAHKDQLRLNVDTSAESEPPTGDDQ